MELVWTCITAVVGVGISIFMLAIAFPSGAHIGKTQIVWCSLCQWNILYVGGAFISLKPSYYSSLLELLLPGVSTDPLMLGTNVGCNQ